MQKTAFVFPGQGSQTSGMLGDLVTPVVAATFAEATEVLGYDLWDLVQHGPEAQLNQTEYTQPALLTAGVALWRMWQQRGDANPAYLAGHSLGEYTALVCAGALNFTDAVSLVRDRARFMQNAVPAGQGAMLAVIGLAPDKIQELGTMVTPANYNSLEQVVFAGESSAIEEAAILAKQIGAKRALILPVSVPSHCELMRPAAELLAQRLATITIKSPVIPVVNNVDVGVYHEPVQIKDALVRQLYSPVRWVEIVQYLVQAGIVNIFEVGPGKVLTGLNKRIDKTIVADVLTIT